MSPRLSLYFLGPPQINLDNEPITLERRKMAALLAYLAIERGSHQRASLSALLWPDYEQAKAYKNLRQTLWEIQQAAGENWLVTSREKIGMNEDADIWLDVAHFNSLIEKSRSESDITLRTSLLADSAKIYRSHFLTGFSLKDAHPFNDWAFAESEELRHKLSNVLTTLSNDYCSLGQADQAIPHARRLVSLDPLNESAHRQLMEVYIQAGQHNAALKQYQALEQTLRKELNLDPQPETHELYKRIRKGDVKPVPVKKQTEATVPQHNLPHQLSTFIGREKEQTEVKNLIQKNRLVTLMGAGGIGKTSLSLQIGHKLLHDYPDGVWFIALDSLSDPALVPQTAALVFNIREGAERPATEILINVLRKKNTLLIFDNCEHLLGACAEFITTLLTHCPNIKVLATSREGLGVSGEAIYTMPSLPVPELGEESLEKLTGYESVKLFVERAALALTSFQPTEENIRAIVDICRKVDGIPLAIELAAARVNILQVEEMLKQLDDSFALLANGGRTILTRHQTLQTSMDWSWGLLNEAEQAFLRQLSMFAGGWTLDSARAVCDGDVLSLTDALVKKSLIVVNQESGRETRYRLHEFVREYAHESLHESHGHEKVHERHLMCFLDLAERAEPELRGPELAKWMERLHDERDNLRTALSWADKNDLEKGLYLASLLRRHWEGSNLSEGIHWLENFIHNTRSKDFPSARAKALHIYGWFLTWLQRFDQARTVTEESLVLFRKTGNREGEADALVSLGNIKQFLDSPKAAEKLFRQSLELAESLNDPWRKANAHYYSGWDRSNFQHTLEHWGKSAELYREAGDQIALVNVLGTMGQFLVLHGDLELGRKCLDESMQLSQSNGNINIWKNSKIAKSLIAFIHGDYDQARTLLEEVAYSAEQTGNLIAYLWAQARLGYVAFHAGELTEARRILSETARSFMTGGYTIGALFSLEGLAGLDATVGKTDRAARLFGCADAIREKISDLRPPIEQADVDMSIAACSARMGESAFTEAYKDGKKMTLEDAMELIT